MGTLRNAPTPRRRKSARRRVAVVTGTRAEFGLLKPVMRAIDEHRKLELNSIVCGAHLLAPERTAREVEREFVVHATVKMQRAGESGRATDARAAGRGVEGLAAAFEQLSPDIVLILGDRIEAFAAASAASIMGVHVAHMHGGDRAEGIADEAMRHAITKLAHIHLSATEQSARRIVRMGEDPQSVHIVGSPAIDELDSIPPLNDARYGELGSPAIVFLMHPLGRSAKEEERIARALLRVSIETGRTVALHPNHDPGREGIVRAIERAGVILAAHLARHEFVGLLKRAAVIVGNSSAGLIECAALGVWCLNIGARQNGRERAGNVLDVEEDDLDSPAVELRRFVEPDLGRYDAGHPYGDGRTGERAAEILASVDLTAAGVRKRNVY